MSVKQPTTTEAIASRIVGNGTADPAALVANPMNWRTHPPEQQRALAGVLARVGWIQQVIVNRTTGHLVDGHLRVKVAAERGETSIPVVYVELSEEEERIALVAYDPLGSMAGTDQAMLGDLMAGLDLENEALELHLASLFAHGAPGRTEPDDVPPVPDDASLYVMPGELWLLGRHRMVVGDATKPEDVARCLGGAKPRLLVTDPPYGVQLDLTWRDKVYNKMGPGEKPYMQRHDDGAHTNTSLSGDTVVDWSPAFELVPSIEVAYVWHAGVYASEVALGLQRIGFQIRSQIIWAKTQFAMSRGAYHWQHEPCWFAVRKGATAGWLGDHDLSTLWTLASPKMIMGGSHEEKLDHPAQKPIETMQRPIEHHEGDVFEPFLGSGTTLIAAERTGRACYGMEVEPRYAQLVIERWQAFTGREAVRG